MNNYNIAISKSGMNILIKKLIMIISKQLNPFWDEWKILKLIKIYFNFSLMQVKIFAIVKKIYYLSIVPRFFCHMHIDKKL